MKLPKDIIEKVEELIDAKEFHQTFGEITDEEKSTKEIKRCEEFYQSLGKRIDKLTKEIGEYVEKEGKKNSRGYLAVWDDKLEIYLVPAKNKGMPTVKVNLKNNRKEDKK